MKIEKLSETQIKCTLNGQDLNDRELQLSELAYGSEKAKALFSELVLKASYECGFVPDENPLMIEAIPVNSDCLVLIVTKVSDPDEFDTRFSQMTPAPEDLKNFDDRSKQMARADEIFACVSQLSSLLSKAAQELTNKEGEKESSPEHVVMQKCFIFDSLAEIIRFAGVIAPFYSGKNTLYKDDWNEKYYLVLNISLHSPEVFNKVCNIAAEYGTPEHTRYASVSYYDEHFTRIIKDSAVKKLAALKRN